MALENPAPRKAQPQAGEQAPPLPPLEERLAALLAEAIVAEIRGLDVGQSVALPLPHDADGDPEDSETSQAHPGPVRGEARRPRGHGQEVGDWNASDPEHARDADPADRREKRPREEA